MNSAKRKWQMVDTDSTATTRATKIKIEPPTNHALPPKPEKVKTVMSTIIQWLFIFGIITGVYFLGRAASIKLPALNLEPYQIIVLSFSFAFTWVYVFKWGSVRPFNCVTCLSGWFAFIIGYWCYGWWGIGLMPVAMTVAAVYGEIRMRYL